MNKIILRFIVNIIDFLLYLIYEANHIVLSIGIVYWIYFNCYFGWNMLPKSNTEIICDGIFVLIIALALPKPKIGA